jgi:hypothetical protein
MNDTDAAAAPPVQVGSAWEISFSSVSSAWWCSGKFALLIPPARLRAQERKLQDAHSLPAWDLFLYALDHNVLFQPLSVDST